MRGVFRCIVLMGLLSLAIQPSLAQSPIVEVYVSLEGNDTNSGASGDQALRTMAEAWNRIPVGVPLTEGYHIFLLPGMYTAEDAPNFWESRYGTQQYPIHIEGINSVFLPSVNLYDSRYITFSNITIKAGADAFHCELCDHVSLLNSTFIGADPDTYNAQETIKFNQSQYITLENNDISGAWDNAVDFVAVQYGLIINNRIHNAGDWCMYLKGGSASFIVSQNEFYDCGTGGFTAGQGTGFQFMTEPYTQYEAYRTAFIDNFVHDTFGAGVGVQGGQDILIAYNTFYRVGERNHIMEIGFGSRSCDGQPGDERRERCDQYAANSGWGNSVIADGNNYVRIPNQNVLVYNNVFYNPEGYRSQYQHFSIPSSFTDAAIQAGSNVLVPTLADDNLQIRGNLIWNGDAAMPLGVEPDFPAGCQPDNPTCNTYQLRAENTINTLEPEMNADFILSDGILVQTYPLPEYIQDWQIQWELLDLPAERPGMF